MQDGLTWGQVGDGGNQYPLADAVAWALGAGYCLLAWRGSVYRVGIEGVAGAVDPPERLGTVEEIMEGEHG